MKSIDKKQAVFHQVDSFVKLEPRKAAELLSFVYMHMAGYDMNGDKRNIVDENKCAANWYNIQGMILEFCDRKTNEQKNDDPKPTAEDQD